MKHKMVAKIENDFIFKAHYSLSSIEQKIVLYLVSRIDPQKNGAFDKQVVPIKHLEKILWSGQKKMGDPYRYMKEVVENLIDRKIYFRHEIIINNEKIYGGVINWFQSILVKDTPEGIGIEFMFSERMKPFLLELNKYVRLNAMEVMDMRGKHAIRLYQVFKAERERTRKFKNVSTVTYDLEELKAILDVSGKYKVLKDFRRYVLESVVKEIETCSNEISISYSYIKTRRKVTGIEFSIYDKKSVELIAPELPKTKEGEENYVPDKSDLDKLTFAQSKAYQLLLDFGVYGGIAYKQILPTIKGVNMEGFEDLFVEQAIQLFRRKEKGKKDDKKSTGTFVNWWTKKKVFDISGDVFFQISDKVHAAKKRLGQERLDNRAVAKDMTKGAFEQWYKENQGSEKEGEQ